jgi:exocyst complex protein 7
MVNAAIDAFRREHQQLLVDDVQLRDQLRAESSKLVLDMYEAYHTRFAHMQFTRNPEKYIRYNPSTLKRIIESLFE